MEEFQNATPDLDSQMIGAAEKQKPKGWKVAVIAVVSAVVVLGAGSGIAYAVSDTVKNFVKMNLGSEENYYEWVVNKNAKDWGRSVSTCYENRLGVTEGTVTLNVTLSDEAQQLLEEELFADASEEMNLSSAELTCAVKTEGDLTGGNVVLTLNDTEVLKGNAIMDGTMMYIQMPTLSDEYLAISLEDMLEDAENNVLWSTTEEVSVGSNLFLSTEEQAELLSPSDLNALFQQYGAVIADSNPEVTVTKDSEISIAETTFSYTAVSATYTGDTLQTVAVDLLETLQKDEILSGYLTASGLLTEDDYQDALQSALDEVQDGTVEEGVGCVLTLYVDPTGTIRGCKLTDTTEEDAVLIECYVGKEEDQVGIYCNLYNEEFTLSGTLTETSKEVYRGDILLTSESETVATVTLEDFSIVDDTYGYCNGNVTISIPDLTDAFTLQLQSDGSTQTIAADIAVDGENYGTISCTISTECEQPISLNVPDSALDINDEDDMTTYAENADLDTFLKTIGTALNINDVDSWYEMITGEDYANTDDIDEDWDTDEEDNDSEDEDEDEEDDYSDYSGEIEADLSAIRVTCDGKTFELFQSNKDLTALVDTSELSTIAADDFDWFYDDEDDPTIGLGIENTTDADIAVEEGDIFDIQIYSDSAPVKLEVNGLSIGSSVAEFEALFQTTLPENAYNDIGYVMTVYDNSTTDSGLFFSCYFENGVISAMDIADYS